MATDIRLKEGLLMLTERLVDTYAEVGGISHLGHCPLPNYDTLIAVTEDLKEILFPGYRRRDGLHLGNVTYPSSAILSTGCTIRLPSRLAGRFGMKPSRTASAVHNRNSTTSRRWDKRRPWRSWSNLPEPAQGSGDGRAGGL